MGEESTDIEDEAQPFGALLFGDELPPPLLGLDEILFSLRIQDPRNNPQFGQGVKLLGAECTLLGEDHIHQEDAFWQPFGQPFGKGGFELIEFSVLLGVLDGCGVDIDPNGRFGAEKERRKGENAAARPNVDDRFAHNVLFEHFKHQIGGRMGEIAKARTRSEEKRLVPQSNVRLAVGKVLGKQGPLLMPIDCGFFVLDEECVGNGDGGVGVTADESVARSIIFDDKDVSQSPLLKGMAHFV